MAMTAFSLSTRQFVRCSAALGLVLGLAARAPADAFDHDSDGDVAGSDFAALVACWSGPGLLVDDPPCVAAFDVAGAGEADGDVDLHDFAAFATAFTGPLLVAEPQTYVGIEDANILVTLSASYSETPVPPLVYTITSLPTAGRLWQGDFTTRILSVPTAVDHAEGLVVFRNDANEFGDPYASFAYTVTDTTTGQTSAPSTITLTVEPRNDAPIQGRLELTVDEDTPPFLLQLPEAVDPEGDPVTYYARNIEATAGVTLSQVAADNVTVLEAFPSSYTPLANPNRWVQVAVAADWTEPVFVELGAADDRGAFGFAGLLRIDFNPINDPPRLASQVVTFTDPRTEPVPLVVEVQDDAQAAGHWTVTITDFPALGRLYHTAVAPANELTPAAPSTLTPPAVCNDGALYCGAALELFYVPDQPVGTGTPYDGFTYAVSDGELSSSATFTLDVLPAQLPPELTSPTDVFTTVDTPVEFILSATDPNGDAIFVEFADLPDNGRLELFDPIDEFWLPAFTGGLLALDAQGELKMRYTPNAGYRNDGGPPDVVEFQLVDLIAPVPPAETINFHVAAPS
jgi:hypothetical protein